MKLGRQAQKVFQSGTAVGALSILLFTGVVRAADNTPKEPSITPSASPTSPSLLEVRILTPKLDEVLDRTTATVILQFRAVDPSTNAPMEVELRVNGRLIDSSSIGESEVNSTTNVITQTWYSVGLREGDNTLTAQTKGKNGTGPITSLKVQVRGAPTELKVTTLESRIPADGRSTATVQGQLIDEKGNRSNRSAVITLSASTGEFIGADYDPDQPGFQVNAEQGQFSATLRSSLDAQKVQIRATTLKLEGFTQLQFETNLRPSLVTGVVNFHIGARGTNFYNSFREFLPPDRQNGTEFDVSGAVFATGKVGNWLFTGAYNSDRALNQTCNNNALFRDLQFCDKNYPVYGDSSRVETVTPSIDSVYLRLERSAKISGADPDYLMWGDYNTTEFATRSQDFTAFTRQLHGFKANYNLGNLQVTGFYANNVQGFQRDTLPPDGTSGYYFLSRRLVVGGSENVFLETEELNRPGTVLKRVSLTRGADYEIDYDRGTLLFRKPILRTDVGSEGEILVQRIVVSYQYESQDNNNSIYAGRVRYHFSRGFNKEGWVGATYIKETQGIRNFELYGGDVLIPLSSKAQLIAEYAHSQNNSESMGLVEGSAYRVEAFGEIAKGIQGRVYYRAADAGFANNATVSFVPGQTRYGAQVTAKVAPTTNLRLQYDHEDNYGVAPRPLDTFEDLFSPRTEAVPGSKVDNSLTTITAGIEQQIGQAKIQADYIHRDRRDRLANNPLTSSSDQIRTRLQVPLTSRVTLQAQNETTISASKDTVYSDRSILGLNWNLLPGINLSFAQQFFHSGPLEGNGITSLNLTGDYKLGSDTTLTGRYSIISGINGLTNQGALGINQRWNIAPGLRLNLAYEHIFGNFFTTTATGTQFAQPFATGQSASALGLESGDNYSIGLEYTDNPAFQASARYEHRTSSKGSNTVISAAATGKISSALTALFRYQQANASNQTLTGLGDTRNLKLGLAYRDPNSDKFNALLRYEYRKNPATIPDTILLGSGTGSNDHTLAAEAIYAPNWQWEFYGKYAMRHSVSYLASDLVNSSNVSLAQIRTTYRLGYSMDLVGEARWINQGSAGYSETGFVVEAGYYVTPNLRAAVGYSGGNVVDRDFDNSRSAGGLYGTLTVKLNELFNGFGLQKPVPRQQQESVVKPLASKGNAPVAQTPKELRLDLAQNLPFSPNEATIDASNNTVLNNLVVVLQQYPTLKVEIQGYIPSLANNEPLSLDTQRVMSARNYLLSKGIQSQQVILRSVGKRRPESQGIGNEELSQATAVNFMLIGASETFGLMASRLQNGGANSPVLDLLQSILPQPNVATLPTASESQNSETTAKVAGIPSHSINFSLDATINANSESVLNEVATKLQNNSSLTVEIQGYITASASNTDAADLEMERVMTVRSTLIDKGIDPDKIIIRSLESKQLAVDEKLAQNSRVDLILNGVETTAQAPDTANTDTTAAKPSTETLQSLNLAPNQETTSDLETSSIQATLLEIGEADTFSNMISASDDLMQSLALLPEHSANSWFANELIDSSQKISFAIDPNTNQIIGMMLPEQLPLKAEAENSDPTLLRLATALNSLLGEDRAAVDMVLRAMKVTQPKVQGVLVDPASLDKVLGEN